MFNFTCNGSGFFQVHGQLCLRFKYFVFQMQGAERVGVSLLCKVIGQSEVAGPEALPGLAEQHPVPECPWFKKFWRPVGFSSLPVLAHAPRSLVMKFNK